MDGVAGVGAGLAGMHVGRGGKWRAGGGVTSWSMVAQTVPPGDTHPV